MSPEEQQFLLTCVRDGCDLNNKDGLMSIVEWGSGGSTLAIAKEKHRDATLVSVEHSKFWYDRLKEELKDLPAVTYLLREPSGEFTAFARREEEDPTLLIDYINTPLDITDVDLFLVDGVARSSCLDRIHQQGRLGCWVLLHDCERDWYDEARAKFNVVNTVGRLTLLTK
jgi:hypothetical protein